MTTDDAATPRRTLWRRALAALRGVLGIGARRSQGAADGPAAATARARRRPSIPARAAKLVFAAGLVLCLAGAATVSYGLFARSPAAGAGHDLQPAPVAGAGQAGAAADGAAGPAAAGTTPAAPAASAAQVTPAAPAVQVTPAAPTAPATVTLSAPRLAELRWPVAGRSQQGFGWHYSAAFGDWRFHPGTDIAAEAGTAVRAALAGRVAAVEETPGMGWAVTLDHGAGVCTVYAGLTAPHLEGGATVAAGDALGEVGDPCAAEAALGPHLHFELRVAGEAVDAANYAR